MTLMPVSLLLLILSLLAAPSTQDRPLTIPEALAHSGGPLTKSVSTPSGPLPTLDRLLERTGLIVRGIVRGGRSYLSQDEQDIYTDYEIRNPIVLYDSASPSPAGRIGTHLTVTILGGEVVVNGTLCKSVHQALPALNPGPEHLLLLRRDGERYFLAGTYFGAFRVANGLIEAAANHQEFAATVNGKSADRMATDLVVAAAQMHKPRR